MPKKILRRSRNPRNNLPLRTLQSDEPKRKGVKRAEIGQIFRCSEPPWSNEANLPTEPMKPSFRPW